MAGPDGAIVDRADAAEEGVRVVAIDLARCEEIRTHWPFLRDRRIDAYGEITRRHLGAP